VVVHNTKTPRELSLMNHSLLSIAKLMLLVSESSDSNIAVAAGVAAVIIIAIIIIVCALCYKKRFDFFLSLNKVLGRNAINFITIGLQP